MVHNRLCTIMHYAGPHGLHNATKVAIRCDMVHYDTVRYSLHRIAPYRNVWRHLKRFSLTFSGLCKRTRQVLKGNQKVQFDELNTNTPFSGRPDIAL